MGTNPVINDKVLSASLSLDWDGQLARLVMQHAEDIDYWEVDPAWDGHLFRSASQAIRPRKKGGITDCLLLPCAKSKFPICARVVDIHGKICCLKI